MTVCCLTGRDVRFHLSRAPFIYREHLYARYACSANFVYACARYACSGFVVAEGLGPFGAMRRLRLL